MQPATPKADNRVELERTFEEWLIAALEHGRAQLAARRFASPPMAVPQVDRPPVASRDGNKFM
ncbi:MAG: hypothetical protein WBD87_16535 [Candidatus Acidiferrales bacterium]